MCVPLRRVDDIMVKDVVSVRVCVLSNSMDAHREREMGSGSAYVVLCPSAEAWQWATDLTDVYF